MENKAAQLKIFSAPNSVRLAESPIASAGRVAIDDLRITDPEGAAKVLWSILESEREVDRAKSSDSR